MATIRLVYDVEIPPTMSGARLSPLVSGADIFQGELQMLSMSVDSDTTAIVGTDVRRTIDLSTDAASDVLFPTDDDRKSATRNLYKIALATKVPGTVSADEPVVTP